MLLWSNIDDEACLVLGTRRGACRCGSSPSSQPRMQLSSLDLDGYTSAALPAVVYCAESTGEGLTLPCGGGVGRLIVVGKKKVLPFAVIIFLNPDESFFLSFFFLPSIESTSDC